MHGITCNCYLCKNKRLKEIAGDRNLHLFTQCKGYTYKGKRCVLSAKINGYCIPHYWESKNARRNNRTN